MLKRLKKLVSSVSVSLALPVLLFVPIAGAAASIVDVTPSNNQGWAFNPDPTTATPYEFNNDQASIGDGSLFVNPIGSNPSDKFIAAKTLNVPTADYNSTSYDFLVAGDGNAADAKHFYLNVYTTTPTNTHSFYNCRFDYVPTLGSTADFTTASFTSASTATSVGDRAGDFFVCPPTLAGMPAGSTVKFVTLNVGDTSSNDQGLAGYLDNVSISVGGDMTTYNFEQDPIALNNKEECKNGGWMTSEAPVFKNQGACVSSFASKSN